MTRENLSARQSGALAKYYRLLKHHPEMFNGRARRPLVLDPDIAEGFAAEHQVILGVVAETPYLWLINDLVQGHDAAGNTILFPYLRVTGPPRAAAARLAPGSVVLATLARPGAEEEEIVLVEQERHATGELELELPRGLAEPGVSARAQALAELRQETGYLGQEPCFLGTSVSDTGMSDRAASFFHVPVTAQSAADAEPSEAITRTTLVTRAALWDLIGSGTVRDAFTIQALALYERHLARAGTAETVPEVSVARR